jgi:hypothetical protein
MSNGKIKLYKNAARRSDDNTPVRQEYVPQYKIRGVTPEQIESRTFPGKVLLAEGNSSDDNPRIRIPSIRQPYAEVAESSNILGNDPIPNVGNNMEQTWLYVDNDMVDDISGEDVDKLDKNAPIIDNNDIVSVPGTQEMPLDYEKSFMTEQDLQSVMNDSSDLSNLKDDSYILIVCGNIISIGEMDNIQETASSLVFGEHQLCDGEPVPIEDIVVLKKVKLKVGLFLE